MLPIILFAYLYYNRIFPDTFYAKGANYKLASRFFLHITDSIEIITGGYFFLLILAAAGIIKSKLFPSRFFLFLTIILIMIIFYSITLSAEFVYARYFCLVFPFLDFIVVFYAEKLLSYSTFYKWSVFALLCLNLLLNSYWGIEKRKIFTAYSEYEDKVIDWVNTHTKSSDMIIFVTIGKSAYMTGRPIFDPMGIVDRKVFENIKQGTISNYLREKKPAYMIEDNGIFYDALKVNANLTVLDSIAKPSRVTLRDKMQGEQSTLYLKIYRIDWK